MEKSRANPAGTARHEPAPKPRPRNRPAVGAQANGQTVIGAEERRRMIAAAAYLRAEQRGFAGGSAVEDWLEAESQIDCTLARGAQRP